MLQTHQTVLIETPERPYFEDITDRTKEIVFESGVMNGIAVIYSQHTSCSVLIQEESEDVTYWDTQLVMQDLLNIFDKYIPSCQHEGQYLHPGPIHIENAVTLRDEHKGWCLNTDAHLRSVLLGRSESIPIVDGALLLGEFGRIYFADFDRTRARTRIARIHVIGE